MSEELIDVVDDKDQFVRKTERSEVRQKALIHRSARVIILNNKREFLVQKRSTSKDIYPGYWDLGVAETSISGEGYVFAAIRGLQEELGIIGISNIQLIHSFLFKLKFRSPNDNGNIKMYELVHNGKINPNYIEVEEVKFISADGVFELIEKGHFTPGGAMAFKKYWELKNERRNDRCSR